MQDFDDGFRSKFGVKLLGAEDLGLQVKYIFAWYQLFFFTPGESNNPAFVCWKVFQTSLLSIYPPHPLLLSLLLQDSDKEEEAGGSSEDVSQELQKVAGRFVLVMHE